MGLFDVHAHLTDPRLAACEEAVLARAEAAGVTTIVSNGLNPADNERVAALAERSELVKPAFGLYPVDAVVLRMRELGVEYAHREEDACHPEDALAWLAEHLEEALALGEVGLDRYWVPEELWAEQEAIFRRLIRLAMERDKPIIVHSRKAERRAFEILVEEGATRVDWHCFSSKVKLGRRIADHGHWLSIPANVARVENFRRLLETARRDRLLLETDCPYLAPERGQLNEPANVVATVTLAAELWECDVEAVQAQLSENFEALFGVPP
ncbi:MAG: TatD family hydrolase [Myxococcales bacterium]|nr:TatD family hydrolase [Myxococcales bacterium]